MGKYFLTSLLLVVATVLSSFDAVSQGRRLLIISPRVGSEIDSSERTTYSLFRSIKEFKSAQFYQLPDTSLWVWVTLQSAEGNVRDTAFEISYQELEQCAALVDHLEEILRGAYSYSVDHPQIVYEDGTTLTLPSLPKTKPAYRLSPSSLLLAVNRAGLARPIFQTIHMDLSVGISFPDLSQLNSLNGGGRNTVSALCFSIDIPFQEDRGLSLAAGWGFALGGAGGGNISMFSIYLLYRSRSVAFIDPIIGFGAGYADYEYDGGAVGAARISAKKSYPLILFGLNVIPQRLDALFTIPLATKLTTQFESGEYTISPAGFGVSIVLSL